MGEIADYYYEQAMMDAYFDQPDDPMDELMAVQEDELIRRIRILYRASKELSGQMDGFDRLVQSICNHHQLVGYITHKQKLSLCKYIIYYPRRIHPCLK
ncbi:hypothetical protein P4V86_03765 [Brevibacillus laterosporus]|uniref:hypothetical protein n=1 Tax=Brevibacillus laterosporus TaxID=1465 RepID=UPI000361BCF8|nr:hypothetical protein [Brevibacillus laterosporus]ATO48636.1 hypothetical protein BrL25_05590 [Brevibacillus laterosporus DSM 25]MED2002476.1 hypothetical protein [Brevibacillus laterosporus]